MSQPNSFRLCLRELAPAVFVALIVMIPACAAATPPVEYTVALHEPSTQMVEMAITVPLVHDDSLEFVLPVWRPGRYTILDPSSGVREVCASNPTTGAALPIEKIRKNAWRVQTNGAATVRVDYRVYANSLGDRTRHVDDTHAFLSPSTVFLYVPQRRADPLVVHVEASAEWDIATGLETSANDARSVVAPNYDVLVDSPLEIGIHKRLNFDVDGTPHEIILWGDEDIDYDEAKMTKDLADIVRADRDIFGDLPYQRYVFLTHVGRGGGGGTEHLNSTIMQTSRRSFESDGGYGGFLGLVAHEFFHTWNVKQLRPAGIDPYDYERENYTPLLWVAEGTTSYYGPLTLVRIGTTQPADYLKDISRSIDSLRRKPGRLLKSPEQASFDAWIEYGRSTPDDVNSTVSFYTSGAMASLALDLTVRKRSGGNASLDDVMRTMYQRFPLSGGGYTRDDLQRTINEVSGSDFTDFFNRYIRGTEDFDFESVADVCGLEFVFVPSKHDEQTSRADDDSTSRAREEAGSASDDTDASNSTDADSDANAPIPLKAYLGLNLSGTRVSSLLSDGPAYASGLMVGDELAAVDGKRLVSQGDLDQRVEALKPEDAIRLSYFRRDELRELTITLAGTPDGQWTLRRVKEPTDEQKAQYADWLGQEW